ncbi:Hypothetical Protein FCC1311_058132 [Hondaea fermentalgiana]|uniref:Uncharacterized protein n=1 Tax=Hondaea fermentalgiana TaxID=2315210 RepID=A0A2R5GF87_9STRA|nr:Hypothetical Protein FCC1311_058132 [Hondaea fermentalgiana]|eukprot:GBG29592.1 Hypothetical Protein FCC1311_058132 [Hondaea fermentalgiana]
MLGEYKSSVNEANQVMKFFSMMTRFLPVLLRESVKGGYFAHHAEHIKYLAKVAADAKDHRRWVRALEDLLLPQHWPRTIFGNDAMHATFTYTAFNQIIALIQRLGCMEKIAGSRVMQNYRTVVQKAAEHHLPSIEATRLTFAMLKTVDKRPSLQTSKARVAATVKEESKSAIDLSASPAKREKRKLGEVCKVRPLKQIKATSRDTGMI